MCVGGVLSGEESPDSCFTSTTTQPHSWLRPPPGVGCGGVRVGLGLRVIHTQRDTQTGSIVSDTTCCGFDDSSLRLLLLRLVLLVLLVLLLLLLLILLVLVLPNLTQWQVSNSFLLASLEVVSTTEDS